MARPLPGKLGRAANQRSKLKAATAFLQMFKQSLEVMASPAPQDPAAVVHAQDSDFLQRTGRVSPRGPEGSTEGESAFRRRIRLSHASPRTGRAHASTPPTPGVLRLGLRQPAGNGPGLQERDPWTQPFFCSPLQNQGKAPPGPLPQSASPRVAPTWSWGTAFSSHSGQHRKRLHSRTSVCACETETHVTVPQR